jgi:hypothetical protein
MPPNRDLAPSASPPPAALACLRQLLDGVNRSGDRVTDLSRRWASRELAAVAEAAE